MILATLLFAVASTKASGLLAGSENDVAKHLTVGSVVVVRDGEIAGAASVGSPSPAPATLAKAAGLAGLKLEGSGSLAEKIAKAFALKFAAVDELDNDEAKSKARMAFSGWGKAAGPYRQGWATAGGHTLAWRIQPDDGFAAVLDLPGKPANVDTELKWAVSQLMPLRVGESAASFDPHHITGPFAGNDVCPVCEYTKLPQVYYWVQNESDENVVKIAQAIQAGVGPLDKKKVKAFVVFANLKGKPDQEYGHAQALATQANTPDVSFTVIKNPASGHLAHYRIDREGKSVLYFVKDIKVQKVIPNAQPTQAAEITGLVPWLVAGS